MGTARRHPAADTQGLLEFAEEQEVDFARVADKEGASL